MGRHQSITASVIASIALVHLIIGPASAEFIEYEYEVPCRVVPAAPAQLLFAIDGTIQQPQFDEQGGTREFIRASFLVERVDIYSMLLTNTSPQSQAIWLRFGWNLDLWVAGRLARSGPQSTSFWSTTIAGSSSFLWPATGGSSGTGFGYGGTLAEPLIGTGTYDIDYDLEAYVDLMTPEHFIMSHVGGTVNMRVTVTYEYTVIPGPPALALLGLVALRGPRRRR